MRTLTELEKQIDSCFAKMNLAEKAGWIEIGLALTTIRDERMYKPFAFDEWLQRHPDWKITRRRADQLIRAAKLAKKLENSCSQPIPNEAVARQLLTLPECQHQEAWEETCAAAESEHLGEPKARHSKKVVASRKKTDLGKTAGLSPPQYVLEVRCSVKDAKEIRDKVGKNANVVPTGEKVKLKGSPQDIRFASKNVLEKLPVYVAEDFRLIVRAA